VAASANPYAVDVRRGEQSWTVTIVDPAGRVVSTRACRNETEALTYASTVRQHIYWLSAAKFREYYRLSEPDDGE
jgi:hypothetical protein